jgi:hypothetical protein
MESRSDAADSGQDIRVRRCFYCIHWRCNLVTETLDEVDRKPVDFCALGKPLVPCSEYEREVGADG